MPFDTTAPAGQDDPFGDVLSTLETVAPMLATAAAGPLAGPAIAALRKALQLEPAASRTQVANAIRDAGLEQLAALKAEDNSFQAEMQRLGIDLQSLRDKERRSRQVAFNDPTPRILAYLLNVGFFGLLFLLCLQGPPASNLAVMNIVVGSLGTAWIGAMTYFFGTTQSSRAKDWMLFQSRPTEGANSR
ncbi:MAG: hypothetical protein JOY71_15005 [Acetobacteraceae bacterium]|nr:hypothetical protein [Acetobacteraceae bacterium]